MANFIYFVCPQENFAQPIKAAFKDESIFDKLEPVWRHCLPNSTDGIFAWASDFELTTSQLRDILRVKERLIGECLARKPFGEEANCEVLRFFRCLEEAARDGKHLVSYID
jgi:hypothetical protein